MPYAQTGNGEISFTGENSNTVWPQYDFNFRQYQPQQGRWLSPDPAGMAAADPTNPQTWNRYAYVTNSPLSFTDPTGLLRSDGANNSFDFGNDCGWSGFSDFGIDFCGIGDNLLIQSTTGRQGCEDESTPGCYYSFPAHNRQGIFPGENSIDWQIGPGGLAGLWQALGLPALPCLSQFGPWCDSSILPNPWILDAANNQPSWWGAYAKSLFSRKNFSAGFKEGGCFRQFAEEAFDPAADIAGQDAAIKATAQSGAYVAATAYAAHQGLVVPMRSSIVRGILDVGEVAGEAIALGATIYDEGKALVNEVKSFQSGECQ
jgi:RHS repeat-associated protein